MAIWITLKTVKADTTAEAKSALPVIYKRWAKRLRI